MIAMIKTCPGCGSQELVSNGHDVKNGKQKYHCKSCGKYGTLDGAPRYSEERKAEILKVYFERPSMPGIGRTFGVARQTLAGWLKEEAQKHPDFGSYSFARAQRAARTGVRRIAAFCPNGAKSAGSGPDLKCTI
jgi:transposase-like protein